MGQLESDCVSTYSRIMYPHGTRIRHSETRFGESKGGKITDAVTELLEMRGKLVSSIGPDGLEVGDRPVKIRQIYNGFAEDKSKPFVLHMGSIGEAVREGLRTGRFGYFAEAEMVDGRYVAEMGVGDFDWDGYLVDSRMVHVPKPPTQPEPIPKEKKTVSLAGQQKFTYTMQLGSFEAIHGLVKRTPTLNLDDGWKTSKKKLSAELDIGEMSLTIKDSITDYKPFRDVLNAISAKSPGGRATVTVVSDSDLGEFFRENDLELYLQ